MNLKDIKVNVDVKINKEEIADLTKSIKEVESTAKMLEQQLTVLSSSLNKLSYNPNLFKVQF